MPKSYLWVLLALSTCLAAGGSAVAQQAQTRFGKNRIQYSTFSWQYISTANIDVYYYGDNQPLARLAAQHGESEFARISDLLGYSPYNKIRLYLYNSKADMMQSNVGLGESNDILGGRTSFYKSIVEIPFAGSQELFKNEIAEGIARTLIVDMMFGGSFREMVQSSYLLNLPDWFLGGATYYAAFGWSMEMDDYMREAAINRRLRKPNTLEGEEAKLMGQSVWNFIAERYGRNNISSVMNLTRVMRNEESSIGTTLGVPYNMLMREWRSYYEQLADNTVNNYEMPTKKQSIADFATRNSTITSLDYSKDGQFLAMGLNNNGRIKVLVKNMATGKTRVVHRSGHRLFNQEVDYAQPLVAWQGSQVLHIIYTKKGQPWHKMHTMGADQDFERPMGNLSQVNDFDAHPEGKMLLVSADNQGQNDLYFYYPTSGRTRRITTDLFDELHPRFMPDGQRIVFASNRNTDSLRLSKKVLYTDLAPYTQLYLIDPSEDRATATVLTAGAGNNAYPQVVGENTLLYLNDSKGIANLRSINVESKEIKEVSSYRQSIRHIAYDPDTENLVFCLQTAQRERLYLQPNFSLEDERVNIPTIRARELMGETILFTLDSPSPGNKDVSEKSEVAMSQSLTYSRVPPSLRPDTSKGDIDFRSYVFESEKVRRLPDLLMPRKSLEPIPPPPTNRVKDAGISIRTAKQRKDLLYADKSDFVGPYPYINRLALSSVSTSLAIDPLIGWGLDMRVELTDMFENHKFYAGVLGIADLRSSNMSLSYEFLKYRTDFSAQYFKRSFYNVTQEDFRAQRLNLERYEVTAKYPFSIFSSVSITPFFARTRSVLLAEGGGQISALTTPDFLVNYTGARAEYVFDNTRSKGLNLLQGTRAKITYEAYNGPSSRNFSMLTADVRHYQKISRELTLALRGSAGGFFGPARKQFMLGGMDNWLFNETQRTDDPNDPFYVAPNTGLEGPTNLLFNQFITNLRGFDYNQVYGHRFMLANAELRFPIVRYFYRGPISSNFFKNFMIAGFTDIGTAWDNGNPLTDVGAVNTRTVANTQQFLINVTEFSNPFLMGYGAGIRTMLFSYYCKFDVARGVQDFQQTSTRFYLTIGQDF